MQSTRLIARSLLRQSVQLQRPCGTGLLQFSRLMSVWHTGRNQPHGSLVSSMRTNLWLEGMANRHRAYASQADYQKEIDTINSKFAEARDEIEDAAEDAETVYFNESAEGARAIVAETLGLWEDLLAKVDEETKGKLMRSMGLKMEQLRAEVKQLDHLHDD
eukprot:CAMPEP_0118935092 /NCGR_PEP_ID=MMETSP1169-20130426/14902_1 /TAXON_ID=36882 /ORGANISM="Pyramimonas obovata, Strain CCMP722" /LENGTH=160 /DNA_ID=CAMNT_0006878079 /DNA_START=43 /DNA_END=525 /DNA_ORIENTATION=-